MKTTLKLSAIITATALLGACSTLHHLNTPATPYQQCNGLKQKIMFTGTNMNGAYSAFQVQTQKQQLQKQFDSMNCQTTLANKSQAPTNTTTATATVPTQTNPAEKK